jgi:hypothetical protein
MKIEKILTPFSAKQNGASQFADKTNCQKQLG